MIMAGVPVIPAILIGVFAGFCVNLLVERFAYRPVRYSGRVTPTISAVGIAYIMRNICQRIWGPETYSFNIGLRGSELHIGNSILGTLQIYIFFFSVALVVVLSLGLKYTKLGQSIVSISQSIPTAALMGVPVNRIIALVYGLGAGLGVLGGILFCTYYQSIFIGIGFALGTMKAWIASIVGGYGSLKGAVTGAIILGLAESFVAGYISTQFRDAFVWGLLIVFIIVKPKGLFPVQIAEKV
jgi:branched-chain amino acid transport system permease protein